MDPGGGDGGGVDKAPQREWRDLVDLDGEVDGQRWRDGYIVSSGKERTGTTTTTTRTTKEKRKQEESITKPIIAGPGGFCGY